MSNLHIIPKGYKPIIRDDGKEIACGNGQVLAVALPSGTITTLVAKDAAAAGYHTGQIVVSKYLTLTSRELLHGPITPDPSQQPGVNPTVAVVNGWTLSSSFGKHYADGQLITAYDPHDSTIETRDGFHYGYKPQLGNPWPFVVRNRAFAEVLVVTDPVTNAVVWTYGGTNAYVMANLSGHAKLYGPVGDVEFQQGEVRGTCSDGPNGNPWAWTCGRYTDGVPVIIGRDFNNLGGPGLLLRGMEYGQMDVKWKPADGRFVVAGCDNNDGRLFIDDDVDPAQAKEVVDLTKPSGSQPTPIPPQPTPTPPDVVITVKPGQKVTIIGVPS